MIVSSASYHIYTTITHCSLTHSIHINTIHFSYTFLTRLITCKQCALFICEILHIPNTFKTLQGSGGTSQWKVARTQEGNRTKDAFPVDLVFLYITNCKLCHMR